MSWRHELSPGARVAFGRIHVPTTYDIANLPRGTVVESGVGVALVQFDSGGSPEWKPAFSLDVVSP